MSEMVHSNLTETLTLMLHAYTGKYNVQDQVHVLDIECDNPLTSTHQTSSATELS
jgi:hypothetical protein